MQRLFHRPADEPRLVPRPASELATWRRQGGWIWLDMVSPTVEEVWEISRLFGFDRLSTEDVLDVSLYPKLEPFQDYIFIVMHGLVTGTGQRIATTEIDFFLGADFLVTVHRDEVESTSWIAENAESEQLAEGGPGHLAASIAEAGTRRYLPLLDALDERIDELESRALHADAQVLIETQALRRDVIVLRRIVGPQRDVVRQLSVLPSYLLDDAVRREFLNVYDHLFRLVESLDGARALLGSVLETYRGAIAERTNEVMKVLTVFAAILLPLSLVAGIWGMNFMDLPGDQWRYGFITLLGLMATIALALWLYFAKRGFIGGPRLRDLPKAVGLGLVQIGTAPLRVVLGAFSTHTDGGAKANEHGATGDDPHA